MVKRTKSIKIIAIVIAMAAMLPLAVRAYKYYVEYSWRVSFTQFEPQSLPNNTVITDRTIDAWKKKASSYIHDEKILSFKFSDPNLYMGQAENTGYPLSCEQPAINENCSVDTTPNGQQYELKTITQEKSYSKRQEISVHLLKNETHIWFSVEGDSVPNYSKEVLVQMIDSLQPVKYKKLPVIKRRPGP